MRQTDHTQKQALSEAREFLLKQIAQNQQNNTPILPGEIKLSRHCGLSRATVRRAAQELIEEKVIQRLPPGGFLIGSQEALSRYLGSVAPGSKPSLAATHSSRASRVKTQLLQDIANGALPRQEMLPSKKELCRRYKVCHRTLTAAFDTLTKESVLETCGKSYRLKSLAFDHSRATIEILAVSNDMGELTSLTPRSSEMWQYLESTSRSLKVKLHITSFDYLLRLGKPAGGSDVLGYLVLLIDLPAGQLGTILTLLKRTGKPVSIIDETGKHVPDSYFKADYRFRHFLLGAGSRAGYVIGNYLLSKGHRSVALFSVLSESDWFVKSRFEGIRTVFAEALGADSICHYTPELERDVIEKKIHNEKLFGDMLDQISNLEERFKDTAAVPYCSALTNHAQRPLLAFGIYNVMEPFFRTALQNKKASAWVTFNDMEALSALFFLKQNGVKIPQEISVIGIDSSLESLGANLTSYNFNIPAVIHYACQHILDPNYSVRKSNESLIVELDGIVVARGTG